jgi:hypothetical protein
VRENDPISNGPRSVYYSSKWLWCFALLFHYCFLLIFIRHFRFFIEPVPSCITFLESIDGIMQVGSPRFYWTGGLVLVAVPPHFQPPPALSLPAQRLLPALAAHRHRGHGPLPALF